MSTNWEAVVRRTEQTESWNCSFPDISNCWQFLPTFCNQKFPWGTSLLHRKTCLFKNWVGHLFRSSGKKKRERSASAIFVVKILTPFDDESKTCGFPPSVTGLLLTLKGCENCHKFSILVFGQMFSLKVFMVVCTDQVDWFHVLATIFLDQLPDWLKDVRSTKLL